MIYPTYRTTCSQTQSGATTPLTNLPTLHVKNKYVLASDRRARTMGSGVLHMFYTCSAIISCLRKRLLVSYNSLGYVMRLFHMI
jgi:hypothetical protein